MKTKQVRDSSRTSSEYPSLSACNYHWIQQGRECNRPPVSATTPCRVALRYPGHCISRREPHPEARSLFEVHVCGLHIKGTLLPLFEEAGNLRNPRRMILYPLQVWLPFVWALQTSLAEAILLLPLATTAAMVFLAAKRNDGAPDDELGLPIPVPGPRRFRFGPEIMLPDAQIQ
ncbi:hypothetical protein HDV57DRAFT_80893 [Trichoderma longibrachiatum]